MPGIGVTGCLDERFAIGKGAGNSRKGQVSPAQPMVRCEAGPSTGNRQDHPGIWPGRAWRCRGCPVQPRTRVERKSGDPINWRCGVGVVNRPKLLTVFADPPAAIDDVTGDHDEIGPGEVCLIGDQPFVRLVPLRSRQTTQTERAGRLASEREPWRGRRFLHFCAPDK